VQWRFIELGAHSCHNVACLVDLEPLPAGHCAVFAIRFQISCRVVWHYAGFTAAYTDHRVAISE